MSEPEGFHSLAWLCLLIHLCQWMLLILIEKLSEDQYVPYMSLIVLTHNLCSASSLSWSFEVSVSELLQGESVATVHILSVALTQATLSFYTRLSLYSFSSCPPLPALRKPKHRVANTVGNNSKWFDPTFPRDFKIWCLSEPSAQCREVVSVSAVALKKQPPTLLRRPALSL